MKQRVNDIETPWQTLLELIQKLDPEARIEQGVCNRYFVESNIFLFDGDCEYSLGYILYIVAESPEEAVRSWWHKVLTTAPLGASLIFGRKHYCFDQDKCDWKELSGPFKWWYYDKNAPVRTAKARRRELAKMAEILRKQDNPDATP